MSKNKETNKKNSSYISGKESQKISAFNKKLTKKLEVKLNAYSASASEKITAAGGKAEVI